MPHLASHAQLPPLAAVCPDLTAAPAHRQTAAGIAACLQRVLPALRQTTEAPFYPVRQVARLAGVSYKTALRAYHQLVGEGWLRIVRGSQTFLRGQQIEPRNPIRGCVAVPVWTPGFLLLHDWRTFCTCLETELRRHNWVADFLFYDQGENATPEFADRVLAHRPDQLFWFRPAPVDLQPIRRIADMGVRVNALLNEPTTDFPGRWNRLSWERAQQRALRSWRNAGITTAMLIQDPALARATQQLGAAVQAAGLTWRNDERGTQSLDAYVRGLGRRRISRQLGIIVDDVVFAHFCRRNPVAMVRLLRGARVLMREPANLPVDLLAGIRVDRLQVDWKRIARVLARQMAEDGGSPRRAPVTFHARWQPRVAPAWDAW